MNTVFLALLNRSIAASWLILAVIVLRLLLRRAPKWTRGILWGLVAIRLIVPVSLQSVFSLIPSAQTVPTDIEMMAAPAIESGVAAVDNAVNPLLGAAFAPTPINSANPLQIWLPVLSVLWSVGIAAILLYALVGYIRLRFKVRTAVRDGDVWMCDNISSPFILGLFRPRIYVPAAPIDREHVLAHEQAHLRRRDHLTKPLGFLIAAVFWFNPLVWVAYALFCKDIELACDEAVIKTLDADARADYSEALLACSMPRRLLSACPLAFGEVSVGRRIKNILHYKKPTLWLIIAAVLVCGATAVC